MCARERSSAHVQQRPWKRMNWAYHCIIFSMEFLYIKMKWNSWIVHCGTFGWKKKSYINTLNIEHSVKKTAYFWRCIGLWRCANHSVCVCKYFEEEEEGVFHLIYIAQAYGYKSVRSSILEDPKTESWWSRICWNVRKNVHIPVFFVFFLCKNLMSSPKGF